MCTEVTDQPRVFSLGVHLVFVETDLSFSWDSPSNVSWLHTCLCNTGIQACTICPEFYTDSENQTQVLMLAQKAPYLLGCLLSPSSCHQNQQIKSHWIHERQRGTERQRECNTEKGCLELKVCLQNSFKWWHNLQGKTDSVGLETVFIIITTILKASKHVRGISGGSCGSQNKREARSQRSEGHEISSLLEDRVLWSSSRKEVIPCMG